MGTRDNCTKNGEFRIKCEEPSEHILRIRNKFIKIKVRTQRDDIQQEPDRTF